MAGRHDLFDTALARVRRPLTLTWAGLIAERLVRAFWPVWTVLAAVAACLMLGLQDIAPIEAVWAVAVVAALALVWFGFHGLRAFRWPRRAEAVVRLDAAIPGHPLAALADDQAIGSGDAQSEALWAAHQRRMAERAATARAVDPDLKLAPRDPFGLRYVALLGLVVAMLFGSVWRVGSVAGMGPGSGAALASGPTWEGWVEPPAYTGLPSLYLQDLTKQIDAVEGSRVTLRLYGTVGALSVAETVSGRTEDVGAATDPEQGFDIAQAGELRIDGPGGRAWQVALVPDTGPQVTALTRELDTTFDGQMSLPYAAVDDYGVVAGTATFTLDLGAVERRHGLTAAPEARAPIELALPMPVAGSRVEFTETLIENLSEHPWAHMPVKLELEVEDDSGQIGRSRVIDLPLPARRFFDPLAAAIIEQRRDLLWTRDNGARVAQVLRAMTNQPEGLFRKETQYLRLRTVLRRLEAMLAYDAISPDKRDEIAQALWDLAIEIEEGDLDDALARMQAAQERLNEAMKNGASPEEVARLMQELRDATEDYLRQKTQQAQREFDEMEELDGEERENAQVMNQDDIQRMMDRIQELMEQGRMAEAQQALEEFQQMMENMQITEGQGGQGQSPGQEAMEGLADTLRDQQGLSDQAFRDLQERFNPGANAGQSQGNEGRNGGQGRGESHEGQGQGQGDGQQPGQGEGDGTEGQDGGAGSLAEQQRALRDELNRQRNALPGLEGEAGRATEEALDRAGRAMDGAEEALRGDDLPEAIDRQAEAMEALREGMRNLGDALAENQQNQGQQGQAQGQGGVGEREDPLGRSPGSGRNVGTGEELLQGEDVYRRAQELLDELRRRSGDTDRTEVERNYLERLLDRF